MEKETRWLIVWWRVTKRVNRIWQNSLKNHAHQRRRCRAGEQRGRSRRRTTCCLCLGAVVSLWGLMGFPVTSVCSRRGRGGRIAAQRPRRLFIQSSAGHDECDLKALSISASFSRQAFFCFRHYLDDRHDYAQPRGSKGTEKAKKRIRPFVDGRAVFVYVDA